MTGADPPAPEMPKLKMSQLLPMVVMMGLGKWDLDQMGYRHHVEAVYVVVQLLCLGGLAMLYNKIQGMPEDDKKIHVPEVKSMGQVVSPAVDQTVREYDSSKLKEQVKQSLMSFVILGGVYYKWQYLMPLVLQVLMTPVQLYESPLIQLHFLGADMKRPFPAANPFGLPQAPEPEPREVKEGPKEPATKKEDKKEDKKEAKKDVNKEGKKF